MTLPKAIRWTGASALLGGAIWITAWVGNGFTEDGTKEFLGMRERGWRTILNPALLFFMASILAVHAIHRNVAGALGKAGVAVSLFGLGAMLVGNLIEFWIGPLFYPDRPGFEPTDHVGWGMFLSGFLVQALGLLLLGASVLKARVLPGWRRVAPVLPGLGVLIGVGGGLLFPRAREALLTFVFGLGWIPLGYALWSERLVTGEGL